MNDYIKVEIEMFGHQRVKMLCQTSETFNLAKAASVMSIGSQDVSLRFLKSGIPINDLQ